MNTAPKPVAMLPILVLPSELKLPVWVYSDPSDPCVNGPMVVYTVPFDDTLVVSETLWMVSPSSDVANLANMFQIPIEAFLMFLDILGPDWLME